MSELQQLQQRVFELEKVVGLKLDDQNASALRGMMQRAARVAGPRGLAVFGMLLRCELVTREGLTAAIYGARRPRSRVVDVYVSDIRAVVSSYGAKVHTVGTGRTCGWRIAPADKRTLWAIIEQMREAA